MTTQAGPSQQAPKKPRRTGVLVAALLTVVVLVGVGVFFFLPAKEPEYEDVLALTVVDYPQQPERTWTVNYADPQIADLNPEVGTEMIGADHILVWTRIDQEDTTGLDGDSTPMILLDLRDGSEIWRTTPTELFGGHIYSGGIWSHYTPGEPYIFLYSWDHERLVSVDLESGRVISERREVTDPPSFHNELAIISRYTDAAEESTVFEAYGWQDLSTAVWTIDLPYAPNGIGTMNDHFVVFYNDGMGEAYDMADGSLLPWARDAELDGIPPPYNFFWAINSHLPFAEFDDPEVQFTVYEEVQGETIRAEHQKGRSTIEGWSSDGASRWKHPVEAHWFYVSPDILLVADRGKDPGTFRDLMLIDPKSGAAMWQEPYPETLSVLSYYSNRKVIIAADARDRVVAIDGSTGAERAFLPSTYDLTQLTPGANYLYYRGVDEFEAISLADGRTAWSASQGDLTYSFAGLELIEVDARAMEIHGLK